MFGKTSLATEIYQFHDIVEGRVIVGLQPYYTTCNTTKTIGQYLPDEYIGGQRSMVSRLHTLCFQWDFSRGILGL